MDRAICIWLALLLGSAITMAQSLVPANWTSSTAALENDTLISLWISRGHNVTQLPVVGLTESSSNAIPKRGLLGFLYTTDATTPSSTLHSNQIALISCDIYPGYLQAPTLLAAAAKANVEAIILYTQTLDYCNLIEYAGSYEWIYSMNGLNSTEHLLTDAMPNGQVWGAIGFTRTGARAANWTTSPPAGDSNLNGQHNPLGQSPSTALAMITLYSITGIITALFLAIVITGALRAHRHPERYGPRNIIGIPRQSRARGLAMAMLETLPIVKFGQSEVPKPMDVELADANAASSDRPATTEQDAGVARQETSELRPPHTEQARSSVEGGIAPATTQLNSENDNPEHMGCSICTEDFETGQDQRVLPCDHRFHPECVDPWLLNVSGTCPLCRIDLRPTGSRMSGASDVEEDGNPVLREGDFEPPPLNPEATTSAGADRRRISVAILDVMGIGRPDRMTREERVLALRRLRGQRLARQRREENGQAAAAAAAVPETPEEESSTRRRLRRVFGVRTRRMGENETQAEEPEEPAEPEELEEPEHRDSR